MPRATADPTALETANDGFGCSLSRRTGEGQGEGQFVRTTPLFGTCFCTKGRPGPSILWILRKAERTRQLKFLVGCRINPANGVYRVKPQ